MTTNQTIDGVPRETVEITRELAEQLTEGWNGVNARIELRALLDAPQVLVVPLTGPKEWLDSLKPAAQPQGEPVAWSFKEYVWATSLGSYVWRDQLEPDRPNEKEREVREVVPLYAEQPAPVAVVIQGGPSLHGQSFIKNCHVTCCGSCPGGCVIGRKP